jgi:hypothetical protein
MAADSGSQEPEAPAMDVNTAMLLYLRDRYTSVAGDLTSLLTRYLNTEVTADSATARFQFLITEALAFVP